MAGIEQDVWGMTPEGEAVIRYTLRNAHGAEVELSNLGAGITAIRVPDREGRMADVVLGYRDPLSYLGDPPSAGKTVGRVANRIAGGRMEIEGTEYRLEVNLPPNHLHGGSHGFANRLWESRVETNRVVMALVSPDGDQGYPGEVTAEAAYYFGDDNALEVTLRAVTDRTTALNLTNHLYVNLDGENAGDILDHELQLDSSEVLEIDATQIPTGRRLPVAGTALDFRTFRRLGDGIDAEFCRIRDLHGYDHALPLDGWQPHILREAGTLRSHRSGRMMQILTSQPSVMLYTGNWLAGGCPVTKSGGRYADHAGVAIECQNFPDAVNHPSFPSPLLRPGELYCQKIVYRFSTFRE